MAVASVFLNYKMQGGSSKFHVYASAQGLTMKDTEHRLDVKLGGSFVKTRLA